MSNVRSRRLIKVSEAAELLTVSKMTVYRMITNGLLTAIKVTPHSTRIPLAEVRSILKPAD